jgi:methyl-accepting chemotaxis protein
MNLDSALEVVLRNFSAGVYSSRIRIDEADPAARQTADNVNRMLDIVEGIINDRNLKVTANQKKSAILSDNVAALADSMERLMQGDTSVPYIVTEGEQLSHDTHQKLLAIGTSIQSLKESIGILSRDVSMVAMQATAGKLDQQIDTARYNGEFKEIATGLNLIIQSVHIPLRESLRVATRYAAYDFGARFDPSIRVNGEWISFKQAFDTIGVQINDAFSSIHQQVVELSANAQQANASVHEVANNSEQVAQNSDAVSQNTEQSDAGVRQVLRAMEDLSVTVGEVSQKAESVSRIAQESTVLSREGSEFARKAEKGMGVITKNAGDVDTIIGEIQLEMKKINEIVRLITDIANQTNLLALNAAIEAARAGEMGRGFAVVAAEVKTLALESRQSAEKITDMISNLQKKSQKAADAVSMTSAAVQDGNVMLADTLRIFDQLVISVEDISNNIEQVASMNEEQAAAVEEITSSMHEVSAMLKDTAKEAMESAHATGETSASVNQLRIIINQVAGIAEQISTSMSRFRI